ncbi:Regulator of G-protein signaling 3, partial [Takifugu flavidus]
VFFIGQLKLSIIQEHQVLVVNVLEARGVLGEGHGSCNAYVKVGIFPDGDPRDRQKTRLVPHCRNPVFLQTFTFRVNQGDLPKRMIFTMWNSASAARCSMLLGCMSFGVRSLLDKEVEGWYYLLSEELGRKKHLKVPTRSRYSVATPLCCFHASILGYGKDGDIV